MVKIIFSHTKKKLGQNADYYNIYKNDILFAEAELSFGTAKIKPYRQDKLILDRLSLIGFFSTEGLSIKQIKNKIKEIIEA